MPSVALLFLLSCIPSFLPSSVDPGSLPTANVLPREFKFRFRARQDRPRFKFVTPKLTIFAARKETNGEQYETHENGRTKFETERSGTEKWAGDSTGENGENRDPECASVVLRLLLKIRVSSAFDPWLILIRLRPKVALVLS
jgi:hypothetical protein